MFSPTSCQGRNPMICRDGAVFDRSRFTCPRGILTGEPELRKTCRVKVPKTLELETQITELITGTFVILSIRETVQNDVLNWGKWCLCSPVKQRLSN